MLRTQVDPDALAKVLGYKEHDDRNSVELGEACGAVDECLQQADGLN